MPEEQDSSSPPHHHVVALESVRGFAALCVAFGHGLNICLPVPFSRFAYEGIRLPLLGPTAVIVFFVMSGYVLGLSLDRTRHLPALPRYGRFLWSRVWRIYPAYWAALAGSLVVGLWLLRHPVDLSRYPELYRDCVAFLHGDNFRILTFSTVPQDAALWTNRYNSVAWTLRVEMLLALVLPGLHFVARRRVLWLDLAVLASCMLPGCISESPVLVNAVPLTYVTAFYLGLLMPHWGPVWVRTLLRLPIGPDLLILVAYLLLEKPRFFTGNNFYNLMTCLDSVMAFQFLALLVWGRPPLITRFLHLSPVRWVGRVSYSFYLWHWPVLLCTQHFVLAHVGRERYVAHIIPFVMADYVVSVAIALAFAAVSHALLEVKGIRMGASLWSRCSAVRQQTAAITPVL